MYIYVELYTGYIYIPGTWCILSSCKAEQIETGYAYIYMYTYIEPLHVYIVCTCTRNILRSCRGAERDSRRRGQSLIELVTPPGTTWSNAGRTPSAASTRTTNKFDLQMRAWHRWRVSGLSGSTQGHSTVRPVYTARGKYPWDSSQSPQLLAE